MRNVVRVGMVAGMALCVVFVWTTRHTTQASARERMESRAVPSMLVGAELRSSDLPSGYPAPQSVGYPTFTAVMGVGTSPSAPEAATCWTAKGITSTTWRGGLASSSAGGNLLKGGIHTVDVCAWALDSTAAAHTAYVSLRRETQKTKGIRMLPAPHIGDESLAFDENAANVAVDAVLFRRGSVTVTVTHVVAGGRRDIPPPRLVTLAAAIETRL